MRDKISSLVIGICMVVLLSGSVNAFDTPINSTNINGGFKNE